MKKKLTMRWAAAVAAVTLGITVAAGTGWAGTAVADGKAAKDLVEETKEPWISGDLGVNMVSQYILYGAVFENQGAILQPYLNLALKVYQGDGFLNSVALNLGVWESFHSEKTFAAAGLTTPSWFESDFTFGLALTFAKHFTLTGSYLIFLSPSDAFVEFHGISVRLDVDDADWLGAFALSPYVMVMFELDGKAATGPLGEEGIYFEAGISPKLPEFGPVAISFPIAVGFGANEFYVHDGFGYATAGVDVAVALDFIAEQLGAWSLKGGVKYYYLHDTLADYNVPAIRTGGQHEWVFSGGIGVEF